MHTFDTIVIGTGTAGQTSALDLAAAGHNVAIIDHSDTPGGVCALRGCQAKKWFYEVTKLAAACQHLQGKGIIAPPQVDWQQILVEKNSYTAKVPEQTITSLEGNGVTYVKGKAAFIDRSTISVDSAHFSANYFIVATGAKPVSLPIEGNQHLLTSDDFLALNTLPKRLAFIGGGFISFEFAHFAARLGGSSGQVHILEAADRVLAPFDADMVDQLVEASECDGIRIRTNVSISSIEKNDSGFTVLLESGEKLTADLVVNGAGRAPNIDALNLQAAGVDFSKRGIAANQYMQTSNTTIFAAGDCVESPQLARVADMEAHIAAEAIIASRTGGTITSIDYSASPAVLFTYPQLGMLGKTEEQLKEENIKYWKSHDQQLTWPTYRRVGLKHAAYKILVDERDRVLGAHFLADNTTGLLNTFKQAMLDGIPIAELHRSSIMSPYPSRESDIVYMLSPLIE